MARRIPARVLPACAWLGPLAAVAADVAVSLSIGADWDDDQVVPWRQGVSEATLLITGLADGAALDTRHLLLGRFDAGAWTGRPVELTARDQPSPDVDRFRLRFDPVIDESVMLVVAAGPTTGLASPLPLVFGQLTGDVSGDRAVSGSDPLMVLDHVNRGLPYDPRLDVDRDGAVNSADVLVITNRINSHPGGVPFNPTAPIRPPPGQPPILSLAIDGRAGEAILVLERLAFGREYRVAVSADLAGWSTHAGHVAHGALGVEPVVIRAGLDRSGRAFFRLGP